MVGEIVFFIKAKKNTSEQQDLVLFFPKHCCFKAFIVSHFMWFINGY